MASRAVRYSRFEGPAEEVELEDLLGQLQDFLLESGFSNNPYDPDPEAGQSMDDLLAAIAAALAEGKLVEQELIDEALDAQDWRETRLARIASRLAERLMEQGFVREAPGDADRFELTQRGVDIVGQRSLRDILGGRAGTSLGGHRSRNLSSGVEAGLHSRRHEFGENLNLDATETLKSAAMRGLDGGRVRIAEEDLHILEGEHQAASSTVLMLDCSHSMILYGEDRFTPAKRVALALAHLIRTQYRGDTLRIVLFHDSAEEVRIGRLAMTQVGPYHTNTAEGLRLSRSLLRRAGQDMKQIIMITDGKPTAVKLPDGRIYKNAYGRDPVVLGETLREVAACRRDGIQINTFMLAREPELLAFVQRVAMMTRGKAYLTTPTDVGRYVLQDFATNRQKRVG